MPSHKYPEIKRTPPHCIASCLITITNLNESNERTVLGVLCYNRGLEWLTTCLQTSVTDPEYLNTAG